MTLYTSYFMIARLKHWEWMSRCASIKLDTPISTGADVWARETTSYSGIVQCGRLG